MRIFLSAQQARRAHAVPAYGFWEVYFREALIEAGHTVLTAPDVDWAEGLAALDRATRRKWLAYTWQRTLDFLRSEHQHAPVHLFLSYLFPDQIEPTAVQAISALGIPTVNFFCDNVREFTAIPASFHPFDLHWVPEKEARPMYAHAGLRHLAAPMAMWIPRELRTVAETENEAITFCGSHDLLREELLGDAVTRGMDLRLYGTGWVDSALPKAAPVRSFGRTLFNQIAFLRRHGLRGFRMRETYRRHRSRPRDWVKACWKPTLDPEAYVRVTRESRIVIGVNRYPDFRHPFSTPGRYSRLRDIEAPMIGACYLTECAPGLDELYDLGTEIATYRDATELVEQAARLQSDPQRRRELRRRGQQRALADHTIARTLQRIGQELGLPT